MSTHDETKAPPHDVFAATEQAIAVLQQHADPAVREAADRLLGSIDAVHRAGLTHLVQGLHALGGEELINRLVADPAVRILLMSYDLIAIDRRLQAEEALDSVRGHLHDHGVDVEILEVVGGVVYVRLHQASRGAGVPLERVRADLETALRELFIGFQELVLRERDTSVPPTIVSLDSLKRAHRPVYDDALGLSEIPEGTLRAAMVREVSLLFGCVGGEVYAVRNQCGDSPLPLEMGTLEGATIHCPWHGCRYDLRSGRRLDAPGSLAVVPVRIDAGRVQVALGVTGHA